MDTGYPNNMDKSTLAWVMLGYGIHLLLVLVQCYLAVFLILSGILNVFFINWDISLLKYLGFVAQMPEGLSTIYGVIKIILGVHLLLPLIARAPYGISGITSVLTFIFLIYLETVISPEFRYPGVIMRTFMMFLAFLSTVSIFYLRADSLSFGIRLIRKAKAYMNKERAWQTESDKTAPKVGAPAPDFELSDPTGTKTVRLSDYKEKKPAALIFGSYT